MAGTITVGELLSDPTSNNKITIGSGTTLDLVNGAGSVILPASSLTGSLPSGMGGKVLQVIQTVQPDVVSQNATTVMTDILGMSVTITPQSTNSKFLVSSDIHVSFNASYGGVNLVRDSATLYQGTEVVAGSTYTATKTAWQNYTYETFNLGFEFLDTPTIPANPIAITYKIQMYNHAVAYLGRTAARNGDTYTRAASNSITVMEISA